MPKGEALCFRPDHLSQSRVRLGTLTLGLCFVAHPKQLNHGVGERKTTTSRALTRMLI